MQRNNAETEAVESKARPAENHRLRAWDEPPKSGAQDRRAADVLLDSGVLVQPFPIWREDWEHPETTPNSALLAEIDRDGIPL